MQEESVLLAQTEGPGVQKGLQPHAMISQEILFPPLCVLKWLELLPFWVILPISSDGMACVCGWQFKQELRAGMKFSKSLLCPQRKAWPQKNNFLMRSGRDFATPMLC